MIDSSSSVDTRLRFIRSSVNALVKEGRLPEQFGKVYLIVEPALKLVKVRKPGRPSKKKPTKK